MALEYAKWTRNIFWKAVPSAVSDMQEAVNIIRAFKSLVGNFRWHFINNIRDIKNNIDIEKNARNSNNKYELQTALDNQLNEILSTLNNANNEKFKSTIDFDMGDLPLWHAAVKVYNIAKIRENASNYPGAERKAYTLLKYLAEKLQVLLLDLYIDTYWVKTLETESYLLKAQ